MTESQASARIVYDRLEWVDRMVAEVKSLPLDDRSGFFSDSRNVWTAESCLRRALEALLDLGRHLLAKRFGEGVTEYRDVAAGLYERGVLSDAEAALLRQMAGYRDRLVHYYHEISREELYQTTSQELGEVEAVSAAVKHWLAAHPEALDRSL